MFTRRKKAEWAREKVGYPLQSERRMQSVRINSRNCKGLQGEPCLQGICKFQLEPEYKRNVQQSSLRYTGSG